MKRPDIRAIGLAAALTMSPAAFATSNLQQAVEQAILHNPETSSRYHNLRAAEEEQSASRGNYLPRLDVQAFAGTERQDYPTRRDSSWYSHPGASATLRQMLFDGFATSNDVKRLGYAKLTRYYELLSASDDTALEAARAYIDVLRYRRLSELASDNWATHKDIYGQIEDRVKAGVGRRVDLEQAAGRLALARSNWLTETTNLHDVMQRYKRIIGDLPAEQLAGLPRLDDKLPKGSNPLPTLVAANPGFRAAVANLRSARAETDLRRSANMPNVELQVGQNWDRNLDNINGNYNSTTARVVLNYNLFRGGSDQARIRQASELYYGAVDVRDRTCREVVQTSSIALNDVRALAEQFGYLEQHALSTEKARDAYRQQFDIGQRTLLDLLDTENELFDARRALTNAQYDRELASFRVLAAGSGLLAALDLAPIAKDAPEEDRQEAPTQDMATACANEYYQASSLDVDAAAARHVSVRRADPLVVAAQAPKEPVKAASPEAEINAWLQSWAKAWESKDMTAYRRFYSSEFKPEWGRNSEEWLRFREKYVQNKKGPISLEIGTAEIKPLDKGEVEVSFPQRFAADDFKDGVRKTLVIRKEADGWKIVREYAVPPTRY
ncbi:TolC family outer membrane protein [Niveibacterium sp. SC-1]|uniref:TolC family outer membrane protein n=1 Tax=Niveibacterium sp. SC-1 TaxID=3135646 RepID=UPI00311ECD42